MRLLGALGAAIALASVCTEEAKRPDSSMLAGSKAKDACPTGDVAAVTAELVAAEGATDAGVARGRAEPIRPVFQGKVLSPPEEKGASVHELTGCLGVAEATEDSAARYPAPAAVEGGQLPGAEVRLTPVRGGLLIGHDLVHTCCLTGEVTSRLEGTVVTVTEALGGIPCRCQCASTIRVAVSLSPGRYTLVLRVAEQDEEREAFRGEVDVR